jgi:hypothetical protein
LERRAGIEPAYTGFADLRVSHFATGAYEKSVSILPYGIFRIAVEKVNTAEWFFPKEKPSCTHFAAVRAF